MESTGGAKALPEVGGINPILPHHGPVAQRQSVRSNDPEGARVETSQGRSIYDPDMPPKEALHPRLYAVTRKDLPVGLRTAQVGHALITWALEHGAPPDNLVVLSVADERALQAVLARVEGRVVAFREPDLGDELTALAVGPEHWRALSSLPLLR